jgi:hypothetical protein
MTMRTRTHTIHPPTHFLLDKRVVVARDEVEEVGLFLIALDNTLIHPPTYISRYTQPTHPPPTYCLMSGSSPVMRSNKAGSCSMIISRICLIASGSLPLKADRSMAGVGEWVGGWISQWEGGQAAAECMGGDGTRTGQERRGASQACRSRRRKGQPAKLKASIHPSIPIHSSIDAYYCTRRKRQQDK